MEQFISLPEKWHDWKITELLGTGSYGTVYRAQKDTTDGVGAACAVKIISLPSDESELETISRDYPKRNDLTAYYENLVKDIITEIQSMKLLQGSPNIVSIQDHKIVHEEGSLEWKIYIRMELLTPLAEYRMENEFTEQDVIRLGIDICKALEVCGNKHIIHRDIKPENIMVSADGTFKIGDFGIAKQLDQMTGSLSLKGTFTYMAPEVYHGETYDARADQYSLGIVLYRLLNNNREPFLKADAPMVYYRDRQEALNRRMDGEALESPAYASENVGRVIRKACAFRPEDRYDNPTSLQKDLERCLSGEEVTVSDLVEISEDERKRILQKKRKNRKKAAVFAAVAAVLLGAGITGVVLSQKSENERILEESNAIEQRIRTVGIQADDIVHPFEQYAQAVAYQDEINNPMLHPDGENATAQAESYLQSLEEDPSFTYDTEYDNRRTFLVYLDDEYCIVGNVYYDVVVDDVSKRERVDHNTWYCYMKRNALGGWQVCFEPDQSDIDEMTSRMAEIYLPQGLHDAQTTGRNVYVEPMWLACWTGTGSVFTDETDASANMELAAAWQNEDASVDVYIICRNAADYSTPYASYWLSLTDDILGDVLLAYGHMDISVEAGTSAGYLLHFESEDVITGTGEWNEISSYFAGLNLNENL